MIYKANNNPLVLTEDAADAFLESVGVELFDDEISIDGTIYEGSYGESILEANGIFLYEDGIVLEGPQADAHRAKRDKEKANRARENITGTPREFNKYKTRHSDPQHADSYSFATKQIDKRRKDFFDAEDKMINYGNLTKNRNDNVSRKRHRELINDTISKGDQYANVINKTHTIADTRARYERRHPKQYGKKRTVQHNSTIFSDIEII